MIDFLAFLKESGFFFFLTGKFVPLNMYIEELKEDGEEVISQRECEKSIGIVSCTSCSSTTSIDLGVWNAKRALVGAGGRALFYPTLLYNVLRNMVQSEFRWWDLVDEVKTLSSIQYSFVCVPFWLLSFVVLSVCIAWCCAFSHSCSTSQGTWCLWRCYPQRAF